MADNLRTIAPDLVVSASGSTRTLGPSSPSPFNLLKSSLWPPRYRTFQFGPGLSAREKSIFTVTPFTRFTPYREESSVVNYMGFIASIQFGSRNISRRKKKLVGRTHGFLSGHEEYAFFGPA
jgi:hypothetical protein